MGNKKAVFTGRSKGQAPQLRQRLLDWSGRVMSWLDQSDLPAHLLRNEDLSRDTAGVFHAAMSFAEREITRADAARLASFANLQVQEREKGFAERASNATMFFHEGRSGACATR